jgi:hypothetical protein
MKKNQREAILISFLNEIVDFIPPAIQCPEITCARIIFDRYEFTTKNFKDTKFPENHINLRLDRHNFEIV